MKQNQKQEMFDVLNISKKISTDITSPKLNTKFKWWSTGEPLNIKEVTNWENDCKNLEYTIKNARRLLQEKGEYHWETIPAVQDSLNTALKLNKKYRKNE